MAHVWRQISDEVVGEGTEVRRQMSEDRRRRVEDGKSQAGELMSWWERSERRDDSLHEWDDWMDPFGMDD